MKETNILLKTAFLAAMMVLLSGFAREICAVTFTVDTTSDSPALTACTTRPGDCSLRGAIARANANTNSSTIEFSLPVSDTFIPSGCTAKGICTITLTNGALTYDPSTYSIPLTITNSTGASKLIISGNYQSTVFVNRGDLTLNGITITKGHTSSTSYDAAGGIFNYGGTLTLTNSVVTRNSSADATDGRGGIANYGYLSIIDSTVSNNVTRYSGGGIRHSFGSLIIRGSTISGNSASYYGGGIYMPKQSANASDPSTSMSIVNSTISGNRARSGGGICEDQQLQNQSANRSHIYLNSVTVTDNTATDGSYGSAGGIVSLRVSTTPQYYRELVWLQNTIVAGNHSTFNPDIWATIDQNSSYNLIGDGTGLTDNSGNPNQIGTATNPINPLLTPLQNNGGATKTHALLYGSPAIDQGKNYNLTTDQRGLLRPSDDLSLPNAADGTDIGAYEAQN
jgi:hypothetical protein